MNKVQQVLENDFERSYIARIHRIMPHSWLANFCSFLFRLQHLIQNEDSALPANFWLINHMHQFIQQRFTQFNHREKPSDLLQLMIDAVQTGKVSDFSKSC